MKSGIKWVIFIGLFAALFVIAACAPKEGGEEGEQGALAGQAYGGCSPVLQNVKSCIDAGTSVSGEKQNGQSFSYTDSCVSGNKRLREHQCYQMSTQCPPNTPAGQCPAPTWMVVRCTKSCPSGQPCNPTALVCGNCGNGAVDSGENCVSCPADVQCADGEMCDAVNQECVAIEEEEAPVEEGEEGAFGDGSTPPAPPACPSGTEACDGCNNDGDALTDEGCDDDNDDYCDSSMTLVGTPAVCPNGGGDCGDSNSKANPSRTEMCFTYQDEDCNGVVNNGCAPYSCTDQDPTNDPTLPRNITLMAATGEIYKQKDYYFFGVTSLMDSCQAPGLPQSVVNETGCTLASVSDFSQLSLLVSNTMTACPVNTACHNNSGEGWALCS